MVPLSQYLFCEGYTMDKVSDELLLDIWWKIQHKLYDLHYVKKIVHGDINPENVMILQNGSDIEVEISDSGVAQSLCNLPPGSRYLKSKGHFGTTGYVAPELIVLGIYNHKIDVFSAGVVLYKMMTQRCLFPKGHKYYGLTKNEYYEYLKRKFKCISNKTAVNLLEACLHYNPDERLDVRNLMNGKFLPRK